MRLVSEGVAELLEDAGLLVADRLGRHAPLLGDLGGRLALEGGPDQRGLAGAERVVDRLLEGAPPVGPGRAPGRVVGDVDRVDRLIDPLALGPLLDGVDRAEEVGALGRLAAEDVADARLADVDQERIELVAAERLEEGRVDGLGAVVVLLDGDPRAIPGAAEISVELRLAPRRSRRPAPGPSSRPGRSGRRSASSPNAASQASDPPWAAAGSGAAACGSSTAGTSSATAAAPARRRRASRPSTPGRYDRFVRPRPGSLTERFPRTRDKEIGQPARGPRRLTQNRRTDRGQLTQRGGSKLACNHAGCQSPDICRRIASSRPVRRLALHNVLRHPRPSDSKSGRREQSKARARFSRHQSLKRNPG